MKLNDETASDKVREIAINRFNRCHKMWLADVAMMEAQCNDYIDLLKIANLINAGDLIKAMKQIHDLDTEVRDEIPNDVWNYCDKI